jgi:nitrogen regulatory protein P-II 1
MSEEKKNDNFACDGKYDLIVTIVNKGDAEIVLKASKKAGAEGGTVVYGRGIGIREKGSIMGIPIEPEKEIIFTIITQEKTEDVLKAIIEAADLNQPGAGIVFVLEIKHLAGICHLFNMG